MASTTPLLKREVMAMTINWTTLRLPILDAGFANSASLAGAAALTVMLVTADRHDTPNPQWLQHPTAGPVSRRRRSGLASVAGEYPLGGGLYRYEYAVYKLAN